MSASLLMLGSHWGCDSFPGACGVGTGGYPRPDGWVRPDAGGPHLTGPYGTCRVGRVRTLSPRQVTPAGSPGSSCGPSCEQLTSSPHPGGVGSYDVWGDHLVYHTGGYTGVFLVDLARRQEWALVEHEAPSGPASVRTSASAIFEGKVAYNVAASWFNDPASSSVSSLQVYDIATRQETTVACWETRDTQDVRRLGFSSAGLVYTLYVDTDTGFVTYHLDLATGAVAPAQKLNAVFRLWGHQMVWHHNQGLSSPSDADVFLTDLATNKTVNLSNHGKEQWQPAIWKNRVVWSDHRDDGTGYVSAACGDSDIYLYDLETKRLEVVDAHHPAQQDHPDVHGDLVVWADYRNNSRSNPCASGAEQHADIFVRNLQTKETRALPLKAGPKTHTRVWGDRVFFKGRFGRNNASPAVFAVQIK